jgi:hypothetical protein
MLSVDKNTNFYCFRQIIVENLENKQKKGIGFSNKLCNFAYQRFQSIVMALPIATVPVLTGEVAERFESEAQKNYESYLNRSEDENNAVRERYEKGMEIVRKVMKNSQLRR